MNEEDTILEMDRRAFFGALVVAASGASLAGCASVAVTRLAPTEGQLRVVIADHPRLTEPGGYLRVQPAEGGDLIYVVGLPGGGFAALSPICTHLGCTVDVEGSQLVCPCHGSTYARDGSVLRGPAEQPLRRYQVNVAEGVVEISLGGGA